MCLLTNKALKKGEPSYIRELLTFRSTNTEMGLRSETYPLLAEPFISRLASVERSFSYTAPRMFNSLDQEVKSLETVESFKRKLKTAVFMEAYDLENYCIKPAFSV